MVFIHYLDFIFNGRYNQEDIGVCNFFQTIELINANTWKKKHDKDYYKVLKKQDFIKEHDVYQ